MMHHADNVRDEAILVNGNPFLALSPSVVLGKCYCCKVCAATIYVEYIGLGECFSCFFMLQK